MDTVIPTDPSRSGATPEFSTCLLMQVAARLAQGLYGSASQPAQLGTPSLGAMFLIQRHPGIRQGNCAAALGFDATTFGRHVDRLVRDGLIERSVPVEDRRAVCLSLTEVGEETLKVSIGPASLDSAARARLDAVEWETLSGLLTRFLDAHDHPLPRLIFGESVPIGTDPTV